MFHKSRFAHEGVGPLTTQTHQLTGLSCRFLVPMVHLLHLFQCMLGDVLAVVLDGSDLVQMFKDSNEDSQKFEVLKYHPRSFGRIRSPKHGRCPGKGIAVPCIGDNTPTDIYGMWVGVH